MTSENGARDFAKDCEAQAGFGAEPERVGKFARHFLKGAQLGPSMQNKQGHSQPKPQHQQSQIRAAGDKLQAENAPYRFHRAKVGTSILR